MLAFLASLLTGCANRLDLPPITARELKVKHNNPLFGVVMQATDVVDHPDKVTAVRVHYERRGNLYGTYTEIEVTDYSRQKSLPPN